MEKRDELLFLLSSGDRVKMLSYLRDEKLRLSHLASRTSMTVQEASRQMTRLQDARLVEKDADGLFALSVLGRSALALLPSFDFLALNGDYLVSHDISMLPAEFLERIGELSDGQYGSTVGDILRHFDEVVNGSREYIWLMADQLLLLDAVVKRAGETGAPSVRVIFPEAVSRDEGYADLVRALKGDVELGLVDGVSVGMSLNEKLAGVILPDRVGRLDFDGGLRGSSPSFHKWCTDLFRFEWNRSKRIVAAGER